MIDIERSLVELADRLEIPSNDWLVDDVVRRIGQPARRQTGRRGLTLAGALVAVAVAVVVIAVLPGPRHAVARWLGFDSVRIEPGAVTVPTSSESTTTSSSTSGPPTSATTLPTTIVPTTIAAFVPGLGSSVSIEEAMSRTSLPDPSPSLLGDPQSVHVVQPPENGQIVMVYAPSDLTPQSPITGVGALVSVMPAKINEGFFQKTLGDATVRSVDVDGAKGYWIEGSPHQLLFEFGDQVLPDTLRLATNTLLWQRGDFVYRIEADVDLDTALRIAKSVR
jgi:hypothetical protein